MGRSNSRSRRRDRAFSRANSVAPSYRFVPYQSFSRKNFSALRATPSKRVSPPWGGETGAAQLCNTSQSIEEECNDSMERNTEIDADNCCSRKRRTTKTQDRKIRVSGSARKKRSASRTKKDRKSRSKKTNMEFNFKKGKM